MSLYKLTYTLSNPDHDFPVFTWHCAASSADRAAEMFLEGQDGFWVIVDWPRRVS